jgi:hypothetical protein
VADQAVEEVVANPAVACSRVAVVVAAAAAAAAAVCAMDILGEALAMQWPVVR